MINITDDYGVEYSEEFNMALNEFAVKVGDNVKGMPPLEQYYAIKSVCEKLEGLISIYILMGVHRMAEYSEGKAE
jgi:hypothetical protein